MKNRVLLTESQKESILRKCKEQSPIEACGILVGEEENHSLRVVRVEHAENKRSSHSSFEIDVEVLWRIIEEAEDQGLEFLGFYHSHPAPPSPSASDEESMERWSGTVWLIVSMRDWDIGVYDSEGNEMGLKIVSDDQLQEPI